MTDECALIFPPNPYHCIKSFRATFILCTAYNRFFRRFVNSCLFPIANLYSNWFLKTILSPFRAIGNVFGFSTLSIPTLNSQASLKMNVVRSKIYTFICQFSNCPNASKSICRNIHISLLYLHEFHCLTSLILHMPMCLLVPYSPIEFALNRQIASLKRWMKAVCLLFAVSRSTEGLKALYKWLNVNKKDQLM